MGLTLPLLQGCSALPVIKQSAYNGQIRVDMSKLTPGTKMHMIRNPKMDFDILLVENGDGSYHALYMQCTHYSQPLAANSKNIFCSAHGSLFDFEGNVLREPATQPLRKFSVTRNDQTLIINI